MQYSRKKCCDIKLRKSTKKVLSGNFLLMNLESFLHEPRELMMDMETNAVVYISLPVTCP